MKKNPLISIVTPVFNAEKTLSKTIDSVLNQTYRNWELILINDGSTDHSDDIIREYAGKYENIKSISNENSGPGQARNAGIKSAEGKFLLFLDADDMLTENALEHLLGNLQKFRSQLSIGRHITVNEKEEVIKTCRRFDQSVMTAEEVMKAVFLHKIIPTSWGKLFITKLVKKIEFPDLYWKEDDVFLFRYLNMIERVSLINETVLKNSVSPGSLTRQIISVEMIENFFKSFELQKKYIPYHLHALWHNSRLQVLTDLYLLAFIDKNNLSDTWSVHKKLIQKTEIVIESSRQLDGFRKKVAAYFLYFSKFINFERFLFLLAFVKRKRVKALKKIKT